MRRKSIFEQIAFCFLRKIIRTREIWIRRNGEQDREPVQEITGKFLILFEEKQRVLWEILLGSANRSIGLTRLDFLLLPQHLAFPKWCFVFASFAGSFINGKSKMCASIGNCSLEEIRKKSRSGLFPFMILPYLIQPIFILFQILQEIYCMRNPSMELQKLKRGAMVNFIGKIKQRPAS